MKKETKNSETPFETIIPLLKEVAFFEDFSDEELEFFSKKVSLRYVPEDTWLIKKGEIGDYLFFIVEGGVEVRLDQKDTKRIVIATFTRGACVGEMAMVDDYPRSADIVVTKPSELLLLTRNGFERMCRENPAAGIKFLRSLAKNLSIRLRMTTGRFADLA